MIDQLRAESAERYLFKVVESEAALRSAPELNSTCLGILEYGRLVLVCDVQSNGWARLAEEEVWASGCIPVASDGTLPAAFVLLDGQQFGLPRYLHREDASLEDWDYSEGLRCAVDNGASWRKLPHGLRPKSLLDLAWLSPWHSPDGTLLAAPPLVHTLPRACVPLPRLCVASLVKGAKPIMLESLILHHFASGFERVVLYFDDPLDPSEAASISTVERFSSPVPAGPRGLACCSHAVRCTDEWWRGVRQNSRFYKRRRSEDPVYKDFVDLDVIRDVQVRQQMVIEHALFNAQRDGFAWLLHVDTDEILFCPDEERHADARMFFHEVPQHFTSVRFPNLEAIPDNFEISSGDPFSEVSLFKLNPAMVSELGVEPRYLRSGEMAVEDEERVQDLFDRHHAWSMPGAPRPYTRIPRRERHALRRLLSLMHDIADKRISAIEALKVTLPRQTGPKSSAENDEDSDFTDDESCYGPRPNVPAFFNSYSNGKAAVRTQVGPPGEAPPVPAGVHGFIRDDGTALYELLSKGPGAPVILHYANCGLDDWKYKYAMICRGHLTVDGAFSKDREGIPSLLSHLAARELTLRGNPTQLRDFYQTFVLGNEFDEVAYLAQFGLVLRLDRPQQRLAATRKQLLDAIDAAIMGRQKAAEASTEGN